MKIKYLIPLMLVALSLALMPLAFVGCGTTGGASVSTDGTSIGAGANMNVSSNATVNVNGAYNTTTGAWQVAVGVTFKETPPADVIAAVEASGAVGVRNSRVWVWPAGMKPADIRVQKALTAAATAPGGYVLTPLN